MIIETKYNIGQEIWFQILGVCYKAEITHIEIDVLDKRKPSIHYTLHRHSYSYVRREDELFFTKEELVRSL